MQEQGFSYPFPPGVANIRDGQGGRKGKHAEDERKKEKKKKKKKEGKKKEEKKKRHRKR